MALVEQAPLRLCVGVSTHPPPSSELLLGLPWHCPLQLQGTLVAASLLALSIPMKVSRHDSVIDFVSEAQPVIPLVSL